MEFFVVSGWGGDYEDSFTIYEVFVYLAAAEAYAETELKRAKSVEFDDDIYLYSLAIYKGVIRDGRIVGEEPIKRYR